MPKFLPGLPGPLKHSSHLLLCGAGVTLIFALLYIFEPTLLRYLELRFYDTVLREYPITAPTEDIVIVDIDERSLKGYGQWPWPRSTVAKLLEKISGHRPSAVGVDLLFAEPDRTSLQAVLEDIRQAYGAAPRVEDIPPVCMNNDQLLAETLRTGPFVLSLKFLYNEDAATSKECLLRPIPVMLAGAGTASETEPLFHQASGAVCNLPLLDAAVTANGFVNVSFDIDGLIRKLPLIIQYASENGDPLYFPSLALAAVMKHKNLRQVTVNMDSGRPSEILLGDTAIPVDGIGNMLIHFREKEKAFPYISAADILADLPPKSPLQGKIVFVGTSATGLGEKRSTPLHPFLPGVEIHATVAQNILQSSFVQRPSWISGLEFFFVLFAGFVSTMLFIRTSAQWTLPLLLIMSAALWLTSYWSFSRTGIIVSPLIPLLTVAANFSLLSLTKFWRSERALRRSENQYRSIFDNALEGICRITPEGKIIAANQALARMLGYESAVELFAGTTHIQAIRFVKPSHRYKINKLLKKYGVIRSFQTEIYTNAGSRIWVSLNARTTRGDDNLLYYEGSVEDITDRKRSEEALRESQQRLADIIAFLPDATLVIDRAGRVIAWNKAMERLTGIKKEYMLGKGAREYALPFYGERKPILVDLALHPDLETENQYTAIRRKGDIIFGEAYAPNLPPGNVHISSMASVLRDSHGEVIAAIECMRNNTERKLLEERLMRAEKMEVLGTMAGGVAHDLNNVLGVLVGYSELMMLKIPREDPLRQFADSIYRSSVKGAVIIQDLLTLARRGVKVSDVVNLNLLVSEYLKTPEFEKLRADHSSVEFRTDLHEDLLNMKGSAVHLSKTVMNLVTNAAEAISGKGEVRIQTSNCYLDAPIRGHEKVQEGDYVVLAVSDTGHGISPGDIEKIFEPFYTRKVMGKSGTGLGLSVVWGTVKDHAGYIDVQSGEGAGSTFTLFFPATREGLSEGKLRVSVDQYMGSGETILVVDDMEGQRELAVDMLTRLNYNATAVASGEEAVSYLQSHQADLLLLDMFMEPGIGGLETYRRVLAINPRQKAIVISGYTETDQVRKMQELGAGGFIRKPYTLENIGMAIRGELHKTEPPEHDHA